MNKSGKVEIFLIIIGIAVLVFCFLSIIANIVDIAFLKSSSKTNKVEENNSISDHYYPLITQVIAINENKDVVVCRDFQNQIISFEGVENWQIGDHVNLLMFDNNTEETNDDIILQKVACQ